MVCLKSETQSFRINDVEPVTPDGIESAADPGKQEIKSSGDLQAF
jgi:hypothetical protein